MDEEITVNRRAYIRFRPQTPVYVELSLWQVQERELKSRAQRVLLRDVGHGGCSFATNLRLPVRDDVEWMIELQLGQYTARPRIVLLHSGEEDGLFFYGEEWRMMGWEHQAFRFRFDEYVRQMLIASPHIHTLYKKVASRHDDGQFKHLDVTS